MPRSKDVAGVAIAAAVKAVAIEPGAPVTDAQLEAVWKAAMDKLFAHDAANAVITTDVNGTVTTGPGSGGTVIGTGVKSSGGIT